jgi:thiosulfate dehydrogenase (quinone) large subunit
MRVKRSDMSLLPCRTALCSASTVSGTFPLLVAQLNPWFPAALIPLVGWIATIAEIVLGVWLLVGFRMRLAALSSGWLLVAFIAGMTAGPGVKTAFNASVFAAAAAAFLLAGARPDRWSVDGRRIIS